MRYLPILILFFFMEPVKSILNKKSDFSMDTGLGLLSQTDIKRNAFNVLKNKCNVCHATKKRTDIFTLENMDSLAISIHKQVFIKKKMPKGRKVKLNDEELEALRTWLSSDTMVDIN